RDSDAELPPERLIRAAEEHIRSCGTLEELVYGWTTGKRYARLCGGTNDDDGRPGYFAMLEEGSAELTSAWLEPETVQRWFAHVRPFDPADVEPPTGAVFNDAIYEWTVSRQRSIEVAVSFLLTGNGDVTFREWSPDWLNEDLDQAKLRAVAELRVTAMELALR